MQAGKYLFQTDAQSHYLSSNYTHVVRDAIDRGVNAICQQVAPGEIEQEAVFSLSCNPDLTIDMDHWAKQCNRPLFKIGQTNRDLPFMYGESVVGEDFFDVVVDNPKQDFPVFAPPKMSVNATDYMIGLHASTLIKDDGEIQIGIGSLCDALVYGLCERQNNNQQYQEILRDFNITADRFPIIADAGSTRTFSKGLFAATEMLVDSFSELYKCKILKKKVYDSVILQRLLNQGQVKEDFDDNILEILVEEKAIHDQLTAQDVSFLKEFGIFKQDVHWIAGQLHTRLTEPCKAQVTRPESLQWMKQHALGKKLRNGAVAHGGFFLGPRSFYDFLKNLPVKERKLFRMKRISQINHLYGNEEIDRLQRINGRFVNHLYEGHS